MDFSFLRIKPSSLNHVFIYKILWLGGGGIFFFLLSYFIIILILPLPPFLIPKVSTVYDLHGQKMASLYLENRRPVPLKQIPPHLIQAFLAIEDTRFYQHHGVDLQAVVRALWQDLSHQRLYQGASTITQQLARNLFLTRKRTFIRKIQEALLALKIEIHYRKNQILELYLNQVYFGHGAYGVEAASQTFFHKHISHLNLAECALLTGIVKGPSYYSPLLHPEHALARRQLILAKMLEKGYISPQEKRLADHLPLNAPKTASPLFAPYFLDYIIQQVTSKVKEGKTLIYKGGLKIYTTLDAKWQQAAEETFRNHLPPGQTDEHGIRQPQAALIALDPRTGYIKAMVGGRSYRNSCFNRAVFAKRQAGSTFKPFVYATALLKGYYLSSTITCEHISFPIGNKIYSPIDSLTSPYHHKTLTLHQALACSCNVCVVKLIEKLSPAKVIDFAHKAGIKSHLNPNLSLALGTSEVTPLELTTAYSIFANGGYRIEPEALLKVVSAEGEILWRSSLKRKRIISAAKAYLITYALKDVLSAEGTAPLLQDLPFPAAGKTGTTQYNRDAWFVGFTPKVVATVYLGNDQPVTGLKGTGGSLAAPIWSFFARSILPDHPGVDFVRPPEVINIKICKETHMLATPGCPIYEELCESGKFFTNFCSVHQPFMLKVCRDTRLLPGKYCHHLINIPFDMHTMPKKVCTSCKSSRTLLQWLQELFR